MYPKRPKQLGDELFCAASFWHSYLYLLSYKYILKRSQQSRNSEKSTTCLCFPGRTAKNSSISRSVSFPIRSPRRCSDLDCPAVFHLDAFCLHLLYHIHTLVHSFKTNLKYGHGEFFTSCQKRRPIVSCGLVGVYLKVNLNLYLFSKPTWHSINFRSACDGNDNSQRDSINAPIVEKKSIRQRYVLSVRDQRFQVLVTESFATAECVLRVLDFQKDRVLETCPLCLLYTKKPSLLPWCVALGGNKWPLCSRGICLGSKEAVVVTKVSFPNAFHEYKRRAL